MDNLRYRFQYPSSPYVLTDYGLINATISLKPGHPLTQKYLKRAGVPESRLRVPLITWWRHHHLLSVSELQQVFNEMDSFKLKDEPREPDWWPLYMHQRKLAYSDLPGGHDFLDAQPDFRKRERDVVIVNVGAHWSEGEFQGNTTDYHVLLGYEKMVDYITKRFQAISPSINVYWRAVAPGHVQCEQYSTAEPFRKTINSTKNPEKESYNWYLMNAMNEIAKKRLQYKPSDRTAMYKHTHAANQEQSKAGTKSPAGNTSVEFLDVWGMSIQRPDAHLDPPHDCLHFCQLGVVSEWNEFHWQSIIFDSVFSDY
ncbi:hypothetical protein HDU82_005128 [Entophlyctis luteolus]|nr:hypothetical protein HDU82_005128 [Entophlyctis luteolus]